MGRNGLNWEKGASFITTDEMAHVWTNWKAKRTALFITKEKSKKKQGGKGGPALKTDACSRFNLKKCPKQADKECYTFLDAKLRHVCNKYIGSGICGKDHARLDH